MTYNTGTVVINYYIIMFLTYIEKKKELCKNVRKLQKISILHAVIKEMKKNGKNEEGAG